MAWKVKEVADLVGISIRTLHYYDEIGLLSPLQQTDTGYRLYLQEDLEMLQQILFYRELDFSLKDIKQIIHSSSFDKQQALEQHRTKLIQKRNQLDALIQNVEKSMKHLKGEVEMTDTEKFDGFDFSDNRYEKEARERWGDEAIEQSKKKVAGMSKETEQKVRDIYSQLASLRHISPQSEQSQAAIKEWFECLNTHFGTYSKEAFKGLGQMYIVDERFTKNIDQYGEGLAQFMSEAMAYFADEKEGL
ncbi:MerR family transcriptional regulator [Halalkalibacter krulwichiae]|uniref:MerR family transcriptional regulator n=1 Tax=Halalkalibacter krulwichiae TaxID=199441 RepID=UPI0008266D01|nr:MerR family transcriptional regulator [Halalkalibacter krulwichiae]